MEGARARCKSPPVSVTSVTSCELAAGELGNLEGCPVIIVDAIKTIGADLRVPSGSYSPATRASRDRQSQSRHTARRLGCCWICGACKSSTLLLPEFPENIQQARSYAYDTHGGDVHTKGRA